MNLAILALLACSAAPEPLGPAFEVNVLWPFFPGGLAEMKVLVPIVNADRDTFRGELVTGLYSDFAWRIVREGNYGKVAILAAKIGYRQFIAYGFHVEVTANLGWRQERDNPYDHTTLNGFTGRLWPMAGWQVDLVPSIYLNIRGGPGIHLFRTDRYADKERVLTGGADVNLGFRF